MSKKESTQYGFGSSEVRKVAQGSMKENITLNQQLLQDSMVPEKFQKKYKPALKQSVKTFIATQQALIYDGKYEKCKSQCERALKEYTYGEFPVDGRIYLYAAQANLNLGYLIIAENMLYKCFNYDDQVQDVILKAHSLLGRCYRE